jgi:hypothetical protein
MHYLLRFRYSRLFRVLVLRGCTSKFMENIPYLFLIFPLYVGILLVVLFPTKLVSPKSEFPNSGYFIFGIMVLLHILVLSSNTENREIERFPVSCVLVYNTSNDLMCVEYLQRLLDYMSRICNSKRKKRRQALAGLLAGLSGPGRIIRAG